AKATGAPRSFARGATTGLRLIDAIDLPLGRPKWEMRIVLAPARRSALIVGKAHRRRASSATSPSFTGTLKSTRTKARFAANCAWSRVRKVIAAARRSHPGHGQSHVGHPGRKAPFVVVPSQDP